MLYIIKSTIILSILLSVYHLLMEREKMHRFNRFYLLSGLALALITPLITISIVEPIAASSFVTSAPMIINEVQSDIIYETEKGVDWLQFIIYGYGLITLIMLLRFINNIAILLLKSSHNPLVLHNGYKLVLIEDLGLPHSFLNYIFINRLDYESGNVEDELFTHEFAHADQWHSLDTILIELVHVFYWFNPLVYLYKKAIQLNHEFLADEAVVQTILEVPIYQHLLLDKASNTNKVYLASCLNYGVTKKRLMMMTKPISRRRNIIYSLMFVPLALLLVSCFGDYKNVELSENSQIQRFGDIVAVDFRKMDKQQLEMVKSDLKVFNIDIEYENIEFGQNGQMTKFKVSADFNNGNWGSSSFDCSELKIPYGIWMNLEDGSTGFGWPDEIDLEKPKQDLINQMKSEAEHGANYYLGNNKVELSKAINWLQKTEKWQSSRELNNENNISYTLVSSVDYNPFN